MDGEISSLLGQLPQDVLNRIHEGPQIVRDKVAAHDQLMVSQIGQFIKARSTELENLAEYELDRYKADLIRRENLLKEHTPRRANTPALKSIVKHRGSSSGEKRVSFSDSPPRVEMIFDDSEDDDGSPRADSLKSNSQNPPSPVRDKNKNKNRTKQGDSPKHSDKPTVKIPVQWLNEGIELNSNSDSSGSLTLSLSRDSQISEPNEDDAPDYLPSELSEQSETPEQSEHSETSGPFEKSNEASNDPSMATHPSLNAKKLAHYISNYDLNVDKDSRPDISAGPSFSFDDIMNQDFDSSISVPPSESDDEPETSRYRREPHHSKPEEPFLVGSLPINIHPKSNGVDSDGGPMPTSKTEIKEEEDLSGMLPSQVTKDIDPATMSFSQRMMWERQHNE